MSADQLETGFDQEACLTLLRIRGLSIKDLDSEKKDALRAFMTELHVIRGVSLSDIAKLIGNKTSGYTSWLCRQLGVRARPFEEARLKGIKEKRRKYERRPFDGTEEDKAYLLGLRHGDLSVSSPWKDVVRISTSTTHPAMVKLFRSLFEPFGHVYQYPRYKKEVGSYEWNIQTIVDSSFSLLFQNFDEVKDWVGSDNKLLLAYLSGFLDAEGSILVTRNSRSKIVIYVDYFNENHELLSWIGESVRKLGLGSSLRINKPKGRGTTGYLLFHNRDYWQLSIFSASRIQNFIRELNLRHPEKIAKRALALDARHGGHFSVIFDRILGLRLKIKGEVQDFVAVAEVEYLKRHPNPLEVGTTSTIPKAE